MTPEEQLVFQSYQDDEIPKVAEMFKHENWAVRERAARWFNSDHDDYGKAAEALKVAFCDPVWKVREQAMNSAYRLCEHTSVLLPELLASLEDPKKEVADLALEAICETKAGAAPVKGRLIDILKKNKKETPECVVVALGEIGPSAKAAIPELIVAMGDYFLRDEAGKAIGKMGGRDELMELITSNKDYRESAIVGLAFLPEVNDADVDQLIQALSDDESSLRDSVAEAFRQIDTSNEKISDALVKALSDEDQYVRQSAAVTLGILEPKFDSAAAALVQASKDEEKSVRDAASEALANFKMDSKTQVLAMIEKIIIDGRLGYTTDFEKDPVSFYEPLLSVCRDESQSEEVRATAIYVLGDVVADGSSKLENKGDELKAIYADFLNDDSASIAAAAAIIIQRLSGYGSKVTDPKITNALMKGISQAKPSLLRAKTISFAADKELKQAIPEITKVLAEDDLDLLKTAAYALRLYGPDAASAMPALTKLLADKNDYDTREEAASAICDIHTDVEGTVPVLIRLLGDSEAKARWKIAQTIGVLCDKTDVGKAQFLKPLLEVAQDDSADQSSRVESMLAIGSLGEAAKPAISFLVESLDNEKTAYRSTAVESLGKLGELAKSAETKLVELLSEEMDDYQRRELLKSLSQIGVGADEAMPFVIKLLDDLNQRSFAFEIVKNYGAQAEPALPTLGKILDSSSNYEIGNALEAMVKIGPAAKSMMPKIKSLMGHEEQYVSNKAREVAMAIAPDDTSIVVDALAGFDTEYDTAEAEEFLSDFNRENIAPMLLTALKSDSEAAKRSALKLLPKYATKEQTMLAWKTGLKDSSFKVALDSAYSLINAGYADSSMLPVLLKGFQSDEYAWPSRAKLWKIGRQGGAAIADALADPKFDNAAKLRVIDALPGRYYDSTAMLAKKRLIDHASQLKSDDPSKAWIELALIRMNGAVDQRSKALLVSALQSDDQFLRKAGLNSANELSQRAELDSDVIDLLFEFLSSDEGEEVQIAGQALGLQRLDAKYFPQLTKLLEENTDIGLMLVGGENSRNKEIASSLIELLREDKDELYYQISQLLANNTSVTTADLASVLLDTSASETSRMTAGKELRLRQAGDEKMITDIRDLMENDEGQVGQCAALVLEQWNAADETVVEKLFSILNQDRYSPIAWALLESKRKLPPQLLDTLIQKTQALIEDQNTEEEQKLTACAFLLKTTTGQADSVKFLLEQRKNLDEAVRDELPYLLYQHGKPAFQTIIADSEPDQIVIETLMYFAESTSLKGKLFEEHPEALQMLRESMNKPDPIGATAALAIPHVDPNDKKAVEKLIELIRERNDEYSAMNSLSAANADAKQTAIPLLIELLDDPALAGPAIDAMGSMGKHASPAVPKLVEMLENPSHEQSILYTLEFLGPHAKAAAPVLLARLDNDLQMVETAEALSRMENEAKQAVAILQKKFSDPEQRYRAIRAIGKLGEHAKPALKVLEIALTKKDNELVLATLEAMSSMDKHAAESAPAIAKLIDHPDNKIREQVINVLVSIEGDPTIVFPALEKRLQDKNEYTRSAAIRNIGNYGAAAAPMMDSLLKLATSESITASNQMALVETFREIGPDAKAALPELQKWLADSNVWQRKKIERAIWKIDPATAQQMKLEPQ